MTIINKENILFKLGNNSLQIAWTFLPPSDLGALSLTSKKTRQTALLSLFSDLSSVYAFIEHLESRLSQSVRGRIPQIRLHGLEAPLREEFLTIIRNRLDHSPEKHLLELFLRFREDLSDIIAHSPLLRWGARGNRRALVLRSGVNDCILPSCLFDIFERAMFLRKIEDAPVLDIRDICNIFSRLIQQQKFSMAFSFLMRTRETLNKNSIIAPEFAPLIQQRQFNVALEFLRSIPTDSPDGNSLLATLLESYAETFVNENLIDQVLQIANSLNDRTNTFKGSVFSAFCQALIKADQIDKAIELAGQTESIHLDPAFLSLCTYFLERGSFDKAFQWIERMRSRGEQKQKALIKISKALVTRGLLRQELARIKRLSNSLHSRYRAVLPHVCLELIKEQKMDQAMEIANEWLEEPGKQHILSRIQVARRLP